MAPVRGISTSIRDGSGVVASGGSGCSVRGTSDDGGEGAITTCVESRVGWDDSGVEVPVAAGLLPEGVRGGVASGAACGGSGCSVRGSFDDGAAATCVESRVGSDGSGV